MKKCQQDILQQDLPSFLLDDINEVEDLKRDEKLVEYPQCTPSRDSTFQSIVGNDKRVNRWKSTGDQRFDFD